MLQFRSAQRYCFKVIFRLMFLPFETNSEMCKVESVIPNGLYIPNGFSMVASSEKLLNPREEHINETLVSTFVFSPEFTLMK